MRKETVKEVMEYMKTSVEDGQLVMRLDDTFYQDILKGFEIIFKEKQINNIKNN